MYAALVLLAITLLVNVLGALVLQKGSRNLKGAVMEDAVVRNQAIAAARVAGESFRAEDLEKRLRRPRTFLSFLLTAIATLLTLTALVPLFSVIYMLFVKGMSKLNLQALTSLPPSMGEHGGGFGNCIQGTLVMVAIATLISVPIGIITAVFLAETGPRPGWPRPSVSGRRRSAASPRSSPVCWSTAVL